MRGLVTEAYVLRRTDYQETSRVVTLFTRDLGRISCLARGAHREGSPFLGALDLWLRVEARIGRRSGDMQLVHGVRVLHGNEGLLPVERSREAVYLTELWSCALPEGRPDPELFDLFKGGLMLVEAVDAKKLPLVRVAMEIKFLATLGLLPETDRCVECGGALARLAWLGPPSRGGFLCAVHRAGSTLEVTAAALAQLAALAAAKGREIPGMSLTLATQASLTRLTARLIERALERRFARPKRRR